MDNHTIPHPEGEQWGIPPPIVHSINGVSTTIMFKSIIINKENFPRPTLTLSSMRTAEDNEGNEFNYYWLTIDSHICCTGQKFTQLLGTDADDATAARVLKENVGKFQIVQAEDEEGPIYINDDPDRPLLKIQLVAHSVTLEW